MYTEEERDFLCPICELGAAAQPNVGGTGGQCQRLHRRALPAVVAPSVCIHGHEVVHQDALSPMALVLKIGETIYSGVGLVGVPKLPAAVLGNSRLAPCATLRD